MKRDSAISVHRFGCRKTDIAASRAASASLGFTLLELLVAMAILALMVAMLFAAFGQASRGWLQAENRVETFTQARAALDFMSRELAQAIATTNISFLGGVNNVAFVAPVSTDTNDVVDLLEVVYRLDGGRLERQVTAFAAGSAWNFYSQPQNWPTTTGITNAVADNIVSLRFDYLGTNGVFIASPSWWNSTTIASIWSDNNPGTLEVMTNRTPAGVQITIDAIDSKTAARLQPGMSAAASNNISKPARQTFSTFVAIPNGQP
jgi:prepilin-type N-terminal cleavage/methylation domain-containing protein